MTGPAAASGRCRHHPHTQPKSRPLALAQTSAPAVRRLDREPAKQVGAELGQRARPAKPRVRRALWRRRAACCCQPPTPRCSSRRIRTRASLTLAAPRQRARAGGYHQSDGSRSISADGLGASPCPGSESPSWHSPSGSPPRPLPSYPHWPSGCGASGLRPRNGNLRAGANFAWFAADVHSIFNHFMERNRQAA